MSKLSPLLALLLASLVGVTEGRAQSPTPAPPRASLRVNTQFTSDSGRVKVLRKRFYLFSGVNDSDRDPLHVNKDLIERIRKAVFQSRDCFYCAQGASEAYIAWLQLKDCETPYCREITADDVQKVREFGQAYKDALPKYNNKPDLARQWLTPFLPPGLRDGYYLQQKEAIKATLRGVSPIATVMTDPSQGQANFIDIDLTSLKKADDKAKEATQPFLFSTVIPIEIAGKFYSWTCKVNLKPGLNILALQPTGDFKSGSCEVTVQTIPKCTAGGCKP